MSHLLLTKGNSPQQIPSNISFRPNTDTQPLIDDCASFHFLNTDKQHIFFVTDDTGDTIENILSKAKQDIAQGSTVEETQLGKLLLTLIEQQNSLVLWYGSDYQDLEVFSQKEALMTYVKQELQQHVPELYCKYISTT